jgi:hypothetical protein
MLAGKRFELHTPTLALDIVKGKREAVMIPGGDTVKVVNDVRHGEDRVDVLWDGRILQIFAVDVEERGTEITEKSARA